MKAKAAAADRIEKAPAVSLSPEAMTTEIVKAGTAARAADAKLIHEARDVLSRSIGQVDGMVKQGQAADRQAGQRLWAAAAEMLAGILLWSALPGAVARSLPASWHVPEWMAARAIGADRWIAGQRMMASANPGEWQKVVALSRTGQAFPEAR